jgi:hypothetical protein
VACDSIVFGDRFPFVQAVNIEVLDILVGCNGDWVALLHHNP